MKKLGVLGLVMLASLSLVALISCGQTKATTIRLLTHWDAPNSDAFRVLIKEYEAKNKGVTIELQTVPFGELLKKISTSNLSEEGPDIYHIYSAWLPELVGSNTIIAAPSDVSNSIAAAYSDNIVKSVTTNGAIYGFPTELTTYALNYNKRLFAEAGISAPPRDWNELIADAKKLTKIQGGQTTQEGFGVITGWDSGVVHPWLSLLQSDGGQLLSDDNSTAAFDGKEGQETIGLYKTLLDAGAIDPEMSSANASTTGGYQNNFELGHTAMIIMADWWEGGLKSTMGDQFKDVGTAPIPIGPSGSVSSPVLYTWLYSVNQKSKHQSEAWKFLTWLNSPEAAGESSRQGTWLINQGIIPSRTSDQIANAKTLQDDPFLKTYVDLLKDARPFPIVSHGAEITAALEKQIEAFLFKQTSSDDALKTAAQQIDAILGSK